MIDAATVTPGRYLMTADVVYRVRHVIDGNVYYTDEYEDDFGAMTLAAFVEDAKRRIEDQA